MKGVIMLQLLESKAVDPGHVIPGSELQKVNRTGVHWLRNSFDFKQLDDVKKMVSTFYGDCEISYRGILCYSARYIWPSGVSLCFDVDPELRKKAHRNRITLDIPGSACDELTAIDLLCIVEEIQYLNGRCSRLDVFFDDYTWQVSLSQLRSVIDKGDFSLFRVASKNKTINRSKKENEGSTYDAVTFGRRGAIGGGKYFRIYDKNLESKGKENCLRWELEFTKHHAERAFEILAGVEGRTETFSICCGAMVAGNILFVHRTGDRNVKKLKVYGWWQKILKELCSLRIRIPKKKCSLM
ncbi:MAG: replication initiation factor domain-containing protein, partial [Acidobacteriota bacterium]|nr:replication initiation factor domain-containing protein [Acidobacteriota bacterium]